MVKNDGTADSKERRHNGNGWRGVGRLGRAGKRAAGRREGDVARGRKSGASGRFSVYVALTNIPEGELLTGFAILA